MNAGKPLMRSLSLSRIILLVLLPAILFSCNKQTLEDFQNEPLSDYMPLQVGKYITYRVDSLIFTNFGRDEETHSYLVKHVIDAQITDNLGRPAFRVFRYTNDVDGSGRWEPTGSYSITPLKDRIEVTEDNLRFIKLLLPLSDKTTWKGNKFLGPSPYSTLFSFSNDDDMQDWDYQYNMDDTNFSYEGKSYSDVCTVEEADESFNVPINNPAAYASYTKAEEKYSKGIGLIYRDYSMWEYQPNTGSSGGYRVGFGIKMWMVDHN